MQWLLYNDLLDDDNKRKNNNKKKLLKIFTERAREGERYTMYTYSNMKKSIYS